VIHPSRDLSEYNQSISLSNSKNERLIMCSIAEKMIIGFKFDIAIFAILTLQFPVVSFDMG